MERKPRRYRKLSLIRNLPVRNAAYFATTKCIMCHQQVGVNIEEYGLKEARKRARRMMTEHVIGCHS